MQLYLQESIENLKFKKDLIWKNRIF